jgi:PAS domain S-box-containing protein
METNKLKILAIDDNRDNLMSLKAMVFDYLPGAEILLALDGFSGLELAKSEDPNVILLDIIMPDMDGYVVCQTIKNIEELKTIPILFLTARADTDSRVKALEVGADGFLSKPVDEIELIAQIRAMVKIKAAARLHQREKEHLTTLISERTYELEKELAERRLTEKALSQSQTLIQSILETAPNLIYIYDLQEARNVYSNSGMIRLLGYTSDEIINQGEKLFANILHPDDRNKVAEHHTLLASAQDDSIQESEYRMKHAKGHWVTLRSQDKPFLRDSQGMVKRIIGSAEDITVRKQMEATQAFLAQTSSGIIHEPFFEAMARFLAESLGMDFVSIDRLEGDNLTATNLAVWGDGHFEKKISYSLKDTPCGEVVDKIVCCFPAGVCQLFPEDHVLQSLGAESYAGVTIFGHTGLPIGLIAVIGRTPLTNPTLVETCLKLVAIRTAGELERLDAETALLESEFFFRESQRAASIGSYKTDFLTGYWKSSEVLDQIFGIDSSYVRNIQGWINIVHPDDLEMIDTYFKDEVIKKHRPFDKEYRIIRKSDAELRWVNVQGTASFNAADNPISMIGTVQDITKRKQTEEEICCSESRLKMALNAAGAGVWDWDIKNEKISWSPELFALLGLDSQYAEASFTTFKDLVHPDDIKIIPNLINAALTNRKHLVFEYRVIFPDKSIRWISTFGETIYDFDGGPIRMTGICRDITERKQMELYRESSRNVLSILNKSDDFKDSIECVLTAIKQMMDVDAVGIRLLSGDDYPFFVQKGFSGDFVLAENSLIARDSDGRFCRDSDGCVCLECTCGLVISGKADLSNPLFTPLGSCWTNDRVSPTNPWPNGDPRLNPRDRCLHDGYHSVALIPIREKDQIVGLLQINDRRKGRLTCEVINFLEGIANHIGEAFLRWQVEDSLRTLVEEKETLLKEVHHRVKNNLAAIMGLVEMQARTLEAEESRIPLRELSIRIKSMTLVHEQLYRFENFSRINMQNYLEELVANLAVSYEQNENIYIQVDAAGVEMGMDSAVPCGLLITELVTNAYKYAFPPEYRCSDSLNCQIVITVRWDGRKYIVTVADNGVGLPASVDWKKTETLGLLLVRMLGQHQLQGQIELDCTCGTTFRICFASRDNKNNEQ